MTRTPLSSSSGQRSRSPGRFTHCRVGASGSCSGGRGNMLAVRNCCYVAVCSAARGASAPTGEERGGGISWWPPAYSLFLLKQFATYPICSHGQSLQSQDQGHLCLESKSRLCCLFAFRLLKKIQRTYYSRTCLYDMNRKIY